jgi:hypothetical protein
MHSDSAPVGGRGAPIGGPSVMKGSEMEGGSTSGKEGQPTARVMEGKLVDRLMQRARKSG